ncbi:hypothetical protein [Nitrosomonas communis]|uniref:hypothetical protein n=1 Tax=Nitrosomonas communis TaxID=44574 RepID=UPI000942E1D8|nr:hypothetical protein [Nitrosomonas communis]
MTQQQASTITILTPAAATTTANSNYSVPKKCGVLAIDLLACIETMLTRNYGTFDVLAVQTTCR